VCLDGWAGGGVLGLDRTTLFLLDGVNLPVDLLLGGGILLDGKGADLLGCLFEDR
jgi:hypothetical protein